jgi:two-component system sensor histidine kinase BaeS
VRQNPNVPTLPFFLRPKLRLTLSRKVFLALATLLVLLLLIFTGFSIFGLQRGLGPYVAEIQIRRMDWIANLLQKKYATDGNWDKLRGDRSPWMHLQMGNPDIADDTRRGMGRRLPPWYNDRLGPRQGGEGPPGPFEVPPFFLPPLDEDNGPPEKMRSRPDSIYERLGVIDAAGLYVAGAKVDPATAARLPIQYRDRVIGYMLLAAPEALESEIDRAFLARQSGIIAITGLVGLVIALALSWLLARRWFAPVDALTQGAQSIARGRLDTRVAVRGSDELARLGRTFNSMAERLDTIEASRRAWLADVAHELRTPLAAMRAEIEALQDGIRSFDDKTALRLHRQVMRLGQLVDDLRSSMRDPEGQMHGLTPVFPLGLLAEAIAMTRGRFVQQGIALDATSLEDMAVPPMVEGDARRLHQVFMNLLENTLGYTDPGGTLKLEARIDTADGTPLLILFFDDSAPGPSSAEIPRLFERLFRGETSRSRATGGSGLGLSICRTIVEAHDGTIDASPSPQGGLRITLTLPLAAEP